MSEDESPYSDDPKSRTSASSRVNFSKLTAEEKERRCQNMSKEVKSLRRKIKLLEQKITTGGGSVEDVENTAQKDFESSLLYQALDKLKTFRGYELSDQKDILENFSQMVADGRLHPDSLAFSQICTLIRSHLYPHEMMRY